MKFLRLARTLGSVFKVYAFFLLIPTFASLYWDEDVAPSVLSDYLGFDVKVTTASFLLAFLFVFLLGLLLTSLAGAHHEDLREREAFFIVGAGWLFCAVLGAIPFLLAGATREPTIALFEAMSGITTTGFTALAAPLEAYPDSIHVWRATLHFFGGLGIVLVAVAIIGRLTEGAVKLLGSESGDVTRLRPKLTQTAKSLFGIYIGINVLVFGALWVALRYTGPGYGWKESAFQALVHAMGTVATGGMSSRTGSLADFDSAWVNGIVLVGMFLGGTSFVLAYRALTLGPGEIWRSVEFRFYVTLWFLGSVAVAGFLYLAQGLSAGFIVGHVPFTVITTMTTTGYLTTDPGAFTDGAKLILVILMISGAMVGSTAGGLKLGRLFLLFRLTYYELTRLLHPHAIVVVKMGGRIFPEDTVRRVVVFFFTYVTLFIGGAMALAALNYDFETSVAGSAASLGNVGYAFGDLAPGFGDPATPAARTVSILLMWLGRLEIFAVLLLFTPATYRD